MGGKVNLAYGGQYQSLKYGISAENGGGSRNIAEDRVSADQLVDRIVKNVEDWNLDGVDFFFAGPQEAQFWIPQSDYDCCVRPGNSASYHLAVIKGLRTKLPKSKTISYTTTHDVIFKCEFGNNYCGNIMNTVIGATHPYLDWITFKVEANHS